MTDETNEPVNEKKDDWAELLLLQHSLLAMLTRLVDITPTHDPEYRTAILSDVERRSDYDAAWRAHVVVVEAAWERQLEQQKRQAYALESIAMTLTKLLKERA